MMQVDYNGQAVDGLLCYSRHDHAFDTKERVVSGYSCLQINSLQIELNETGQLLYVWGYSPYESWKGSKLSLPQSKEGTITYAGPLPVPGSSRRITNESFLSVLFDKRQDLVCIGDCSREGEAIRFAPGAIAVLQSGELVSLWLKFRSA
jgi:hypothetical protein